MKITRVELKALIHEAIAKEASVLLETPNVPNVPIVGQEQTGDYTKDPDGYEGDMAKRSLYHIARQADQLHDMIMDDENLEPWAQAKITKAADYIRSVFEVMTHEKGNPRGR
jgi:hypothetical protein